MHLAELNIGRLRYPIDDPRSADFADNLDLVNGLAERSEGFVWRLKDDASGDATKFRPYDDPNVIVNLSVWESAEALETFVWKTVHKRFYGRRPEWFAPMEKPHFVMWHIEPGHIPTIEEAVECLARLTADGPSPEAFGWESLPHITLWKSARCA